MPGTWVRSLIRDDSTGHRADEPVHHAAKATCSRACVLLQERPLHCEAHSLQLEKARAYEQRDSAAKKKTCTEQVLSVAHNMHSVLSLESSPVENSSELHTSRDLLRDLRRYRLDAYCCSGMRNCHPHLHSLPRTELTHHG